MRTVSNCQEAPVSFLLLPRLLFTRSPPHRHLAVSRHVGPWIPVKPVKGSLPGLRAIHRGGAQRAGGEHGRVGGRSAAVAGLSDFCFWTPRSPFLDSRNPTIARRLPLGFHFLPFWCSLFYQTGKKVDFFEHRPVIARNTMKRGSTRVLKLGDKDGAISEASRVARRRWPRFGLFDMSAPAG